jgi:hypothetical protein
MSMITGSRAPGAPKAIGFEPRKMRFMPGGTMIESVCVSAMPIMPLRTAISTNQAHAPQCELLRATTAPTPLCAARAIASSIARLATSWPMPRSPSTTAADGPVRRSVMLGCAFTVPLRRRVA